MSEKIKVAIIGCGTIATSAHMPGYKANADIAEVKYFCDIIPERAVKLRDAYGSGEVVVDYHDILDDPEITCVSVCTPNYVHAPIAIDFLNHGKHVLCEKPAAITADKALEMKKAADETGYILNIGVCNRFKNDIIKVQEIIASGELGDIYHVYCSFRNFRSIPGLGGPFTTKSMAGGGALIDWGVHFLDLIMYCIDQPKVKTVSAECYSILGKEMEGYTYTSMWAGPPDYSGTYDVEEFCTGLIRTEGPSITMNGAWAQNIFEEAMFVEFLGTKGGIKLNYGGGFTIYGTKNGMLTETKIAQKKNNMYDDEIRDFLIKAPQRIKTKANIDNALITSQLMEQIYQSAAEHKELVVG
ncbi:MAG: Gfo/Idh/MocA family oxidoreductase [Clostridia bacterium]|nr:Gfo/Idh/MocA family oxidoreductase [Clostridia bacterium]MBQ4085864.1 Gfo/Idh/MocA family oxidoreductase [Clostridia bacterium]